jgi:hypothetical protein
MPKQPATMEDVVLYGKKYLNQIDALDARIDVLDAELDDRGAAAWIKFNMATDAIAASFNVSSITNYGTGRDTIVWDTDFASADYAVVASGIKAGVSLNTLACESYGPEACTILSRNSSNVDSNSTLACVVAFGAQV